MQSHTPAGYFPSPHQKRVWIAQQGSPNLLRIQIAAELQGSIQLERMQTAFREAVSRHEIFRTVFRRQPGLKVPFQVVLDACPVELRVQDLPQNAFENHDQGLRHLLEAESATPFDFERGPLVRALLAGRNSARSLFVLTASPLCCDVPSLRMLVDEILGRYATIFDCSASEPLRYAQFSQWQNDLLESDDESAREGKAYWAERLKSAAEPVSLPFERKGESDSGVQKIGDLVAADTLAKLEELAADWATSVEVVLLTAWQVLLYRMTGKAEFTVWVSATGREYEELAEAIGPIEKVFPLVVHFESDFKFAEAVRHTATALAQAMGYNEYFDPSSDGVHDPGLTFQFRTTPAIREFGGLKRTFSYEDVFAEVPELNLSCVHGNSNLSLQFSYKASRFPRRAIERLVAYFEVLLKGALQSPNTAIGLLPLQSELDRHRIVVEWNKTEASYPQSCLHELFEKQAARTPDSTAVHCGEVALTFRQLNEASNRLAHYLKSVGVAPNKLVGLFLNRSVDMMVAVLAIMKAGGAYVPLNTDNPKSRLEQQLNDVAALMTQEELRADAPCFAGPVLCIDSDRNRWENEVATNPEHETTPDDLAYVIYTSGSTGVPKGVAVRHRNLVNYSAHIARELDLEHCSPGLQFATVSTLGADLGNTCIYPSLISGGTLHILPYEVATESHKMAAYQNRHQIDVLKIVPSQLAALMNSPEGARVLPKKYLITGGETLSRNLVSKILASDATCEVINHYGPTETTVGSLMRALKDFDWDGCSANSIPIGRPIANTRVYVLDSLMQPVPVGVAGELYIAGAGVAAGYLNQPERTAERFVPEPFSGIKNSLMYRTGDLVRYLEDGNVEFLGRADDQIKVRGFRIELGEIESALQKLTGVKQAFVMAHEDEAHEKQLAAYVILDRDSQITTQQVREDLRSQLPDYMVPPSIIALEKLPLTSNGKVDRQALSKLGDHTRTEKTFIPPQTSTEEALANIWVELLRRQRISSDDNFFDLGGHSLSGTQVISRVREQFRVEVALRTLFEKPTLSGLAAAIDSATGSAHATEGPIQRVSRDAYRQAAKKQ